MRGVDILANAVVVALGSKARHVVIDPAKLVRSAFQGGASVAGLLITTDAAMARLPEAPGAPTANSGGMDF